jgi:hypothetical protein
MSATGTMAHKFPAILTYVPSAAQAICESVNSFASLGRVSAIQGKPINVTHLSRVNSPARNIINEEGNARRAGGFQWMIRVEEELGYS